MLKISYSIVDGEIFFSPGEPWSETVSDIYSLVHNTFTDPDIHVTKEGGLSISVPIFLEYFDSIIDILNYSGEEVSLSDEAQDIIRKVREILDTEDIFRDKETADELQKKLDNAGWNSEKRRLSDFQMRNLKQTTRRDNAAIFSVPGAGKTVEALAFSTIVGGPGVYYVIVCPRNAYISWEIELQESLNVPSEKIFRAIGDDEILRDKLLLGSEPPKAVLINYNRLWLRYRSISEYIQTIENRGNKIVLILDESHHFKGGKSFTSGVRRISPFASHRVILSGTPMPKDCSDLVHQFRALIPHQINEITNDSVLEFTSGRFVRTTKGDQGLKDPVITIQQFDMNDMQKDLHSLLRDWFDERIQNIGNRRILAEVARLQRVLIFAVMVCSNPSLLNNKFDDLLLSIDPDLANKLQELDGASDDYGPKFRYAIERARDLASEGKKVLIWTSFVDNVALLAEELEDLGAVYIRGDVPTEDGIDDPFRSYSDAPDEEENTREKIIHKFKTSEECMVMVANPAAAGEGISLHDVCHHAIYVDRTFHATQFMQSMDRIHRYGIDEDGELICNKYQTDIEILECKDSIDLMVHRNLGRKMEAMYAWLEDPNLNPLLGLLEPQISEEEIVQFVNLDR